MNLGVGVNIPSLIETGKFTLGASCDYWDQDIYGSGGAVSINMQYRFYKGFGLLLNGSWKAKGYLIGRRTEETPTLLAGFNYRF